MDGVTLSPAVHLAIASALVALAFVRARADGHPRSRRFYDFFGGVELILIGLLLGTLVVVGFLQIVLRNTLHTGLLWADPLMRHIVLWLGALGASLATARLRHINIDVFSRLLPKRLSGLRRFVIYGATAVAAFTLGIASLRLVIDERSFGDTAFLGLETWLLQVVLPFSFFLISYRSLVNLFLGRDARIGGGEIEAES